MPLEKTIIRCDCNQEELVELAQTQSYSQTPKESTILYSCPKCSSIYYRDRSNYGNFLSGDEIDFGDFFKYEGFLNEQEIKDNVPKKYGTFRPLCASEIAIAKELGHYFEAKDRDKTLRAIICESKSDKKVVLWLSKGFQHQLAEYKKGSETKRMLLTNEQAVPIPPKFRLGRAIPEYLQIYNTLGPDLKEQIPPYWHDCLGSWLTTKK